MENISPQRARRTALGRKHTASRELVLRELELRGPTSVSALATRTGLHENTVRGHLSALRADGHVRQDSTPAASTAGASSRGRGRPTLVWSAVPAEVLHPYAGLALTLAHALDKAHPGASNIAREAGAAWGEKLASERGAGATEQGSPSLSARALALTIMREQGFAPDEEDPSGELDPSGDAPITLHRCPLLAVAAEQSDVVCAVHEGMLTGITRSRNPDAKVKLLPFVSPGTCLLQVQVQVQAS